MKGGEVEIVGGGGRCEGGGEVDIVGGGGRCEGGGGGRHSGRWREV